MKKNTTMEKHVVPVVEKKILNIHFELPSYENLRNAAFKKRRSMNEIVRTAVDNYLKIM